MHAHDSSRPRLLVREAGALGKLVQYSKNPDVALVCQRLACNNHTPARPMEVSAKFVRLRPCSHVPPAILQWSGQPHPVQQRHPQGYDRIAQASVRARRSIDELPRYANAVPSTADASFEDVTDAQLLPYLP